MDRRTRWMRWSAIGAAAMVALTGCGGGEEPEASDAPSQSSTAPPSDEDIRSQAEGVYAAYLAEVADMYRSGDDDYTRLLDWATSEMATREAAGVADLTAEGVTASDWYTVASFELGSADEGSVQIHACVDVGSVLLTGPDGEDVTPVDREPLVPLLLRFEREGDSTLLLDAQDPWDPNKGESPCAALS